MGDSARAGDDTLRAPSDAPLAGRRHRPLTGTAGILLFACLFLPALRGCGGAEVTPLEAPPLLPPYLYGLVFAALALARTRGQLALGVLALRALATAITFAGGVMFVVAPAIGVVELTLGLALVAAIGARGVDEARVAMSAAVMGAVGTLWFALWCSADGALVGLRLALGCSGALLAGGLVWLAECVPARRGFLPPAIARVRRGVLRSPR